jgi:hypothetical protein
MNRMERYLTCAFALALCAGHGLRAQVTGTIRFDLAPAGTTRYVVDGRYRMSERQVELMEGPHRFVFWAPERRMLDTTINVAGGRVIDVPVTLRYSEEFIAWRKRSDRGRVERAWARHAPPVLMVGAGAWAIASYVRHEQAYSDLKALASEYATSVDPGRIADIKAEVLPEAKNALRETGTGMVVAGGVFALATAATIFLRMRYRDRDVEPFEDRERLRFEGLVWSPVPGGGLLGASLSMPLHR